MTTKPLTQPGLMESERAASGLGGFVEIPTLAFVGKVDVGMAPLPPIAFYVVKLGQLEVLRAPDQPFSPLVLSQHETVFIRREDIRHVLPITDSLLSDPKLTMKLPIEQRIIALQRSAMVVVEDIFDNPSPENVQRGVKAVSSFVNVLMRDPKAYFLLSKLSSHDPYTAQHSIGTAVNSIILGRKLGIRDEEELLDLGIGGLLHDIGKTTVRKEIINKPGPLDDAEWNEMRAHSGAGFEIVKNHPSLSERSKRAILEHHEEKDGSGYPHGIGGGDIHLFARIVCLCDIFNALTTNRSYSTARTPFEAFQIMRGEKLSKKIDQDLFRLMVKVYGGEVA